MWRWMIILLWAGAVPGFMHAGLHYSGEAFNPLPAKWRGFLPDQRLLRNLAVPQTLPSPMAHTYADALLKLEARSRTGMLTATEAADLGALYLRMNKVEEALGVLRAASRRYPEEFAVQANLGTAWHLAGDLDQAQAALTEAVLLAPPRWKPYEEAHLKLVTLRRAEQRASRPTDTIDDLFGVRYVGPNGQPQAGPLPLAKTLPENALHIVQQLALWLPADGRLLWQLGEIANAHGDVRTAANILDGCVTEFGMKSADLRASRQLYRQAADALLKLPDHEQHTSTLKFASPRALTRTFDPALLPPIPPTGTTTLPWIVLGETTIGRRFPPEYLPYLEKLDGRHVQVIGFMRPAGLASPTVQAFLLTETPVGCWFCESPDPTGILAVELAPGETTEIARHAVKVEGILRLNRTDPESYLYELTEARIAVAD